MANTPESVKERFVEKQAKMVPWYYLSAKKA
jgi:hypothetical protein